LKIGCWKHIGSKKDEVTGEWRRLYNEELYVLFSSIEIIRIRNINEIGGACGRCGRQKSSIPGPGEYTRE
jgi:hypothetical protein